MRPPTKARGWQSMLAIFPRRLRSGASSGWLVCVIRQRVNETEFISTIKAPMISYRLYRLAMTGLARSMRALMRARGIDGTFCVSSAAAFYEWQGMRFGYSYSEFGAAGIDAGGSTEPLTRAKLKEFLNNDSVFYDIGAHEGLYSIFAKKYSPGIKVHAFEPQPDNLIRNLSINNLPDIVVHPVAVGDEPGSFFMATDERSSNHINGKTGSIPVIMIDGENLPPPTLIKIDIEGFELNALKGARDTLLKSKPVIVTEINHCFLRYNKTLEPFYDFMTSVGYQIHALRGDKLVPIKPSTSLDKLEHSDEDNYWWLPS
jgi:FkbM family methyltransferase